MASLCMHLYVGRGCISLENKPSSLPQYYLGCIAPDCVNLEGFAPKQVRWRAHLRDGNLGKWYENAAAFYRAQKGRADGSLLLGYVTHIITDIVWDERFHDRIWSGMRRLDLPPMIVVDHKDLGWDDCFRFDHDACAQPWFCDEVLPALRAAEPQEIGGLSAELLARFRDDTVERYPHSIPEGNPRLVTVNVVEALTAAVRQKCAELLH